MGRGWGAAGCRERWYREVRVKGEWECARAGTESVAVRASALPASAVSVRQPTARSSKHWLPFAPLPVGRPGVRARDPYIGRVVRLGQRKLGGVVDGSRGRWLALTSMVGGARVALGPGSPCTSPRRLRVRSGGPEWAVAPTLALCRQYGPGCAGGERIQRRPAVAGGRARRPPPRRRSSYQLPRVRCPRKVSTGSTLC